MFIQLQLVCGLVPGTVVPLLLSKAKGNLLPIRMISSQFRLEFGYDCLIKFRRDKGSTQFVVHRICTVVVVHLIFFLINSRILADIHSLHRRFPHVLYEPIV